MGYSALEAGTTLALMSIGWPIASTLSGRLMVYTSYRTTALLGALLLIAGSLCLLWQTPQEPVVGAYFGLHHRCGDGNDQYHLLVSVQNSAPHSMRGIATACTVFTRMLGSALGTAILGATLNLNLAGAYRR